MASAKNSIRKKVKRIRPTSIEWLYFKDLPQSRFREIVEMINERTDVGDLSGLSEEERKNKLEKQDEEAMKVVVHLFNNVFCDANGELFDDINTFEDVRDELGLMAVNEMFEAYMEAVSKSVKKLPATK